MKFEEALSALRQGYKIRHPSFAEDEYLVGCYITLTTVFDDDGKEVIDSFDDAKARGMSIVKIKGDRQHDEMVGRLNYVGKIKRQLKEILTEEDYKKYHNVYTDMAISGIFDKDLFLFPQLNLLLVMSDAWVISFGDIK